MGGRGGLGDGGDDFRILLGGGNEASIIPNGQPKTPPGNFSYALRGLASTWLPGSGLPPFLDATLKPSSLRLARRSLSPALIGGWS